MVVFCVITFRVDWSNMYFSNYFRCFIHRKSVGGLMKVLTGSQSDRSPITEMCELSCD